MNLLEVERLFTLLEKNISSLVNGINITASSSGFDEVQTSITGTTFVILDNIPCKNLSIVNDTGIDIEVSKTGSVTAIPVFDGSYFTFSGLSNANELSVRRKDTLNTQVVIKYIWEN